MDRLVASARLQRGAQRMGQAPRPPLICWRQSGSMDGDLQGPSRSYRPSAGASWRPRTGTPNWSRQWTAAPSCMCRPLPLAVRNTPLAEQLLVLRPRAPIGFRARHADRDGRSRRSLLSLAHRVCLGWQIRRRLLRRSKPPVGGEGWHPFAVGFDVPSHGCEEPNG